MEIWRRVHNAAISLRPRASGASVLIAWFLPSRGCDGGSRQYAGLSPHSCRRMDTSIEVKERCVQREEATNANSGRIENTV